MKVYNNKNKAKQRTKGTCPALTLTCHVCGITGLAEGSTLPGKMAHITPMGNTASRQESRQMTALGMGAILCARAKPGYNWRWRLTAQHRSKTWNTQTGSVMQPRLIIQSCRLNCDPSTLANGPEFDDWI